MPRTAALSFVCRRPLALRWAGPWRVRYLGAPSMSTPVLAAWPDESTALLGRWAATPRKAPSTELSAGRSQFLIRAGKTFKPWRHGASGRPQRAAAPAQLRAAASSGAGQPGKSVAHDSSDEAPGKAFRPSTEAVAEEGKKTSPRYLAQARRAKEPAGQRQAAPFQARH
jgi:hypothetical protein